MSASPCSRSTSSQASPSISPTAQPEREQQDVPGVHRVVVLSRRLEERPSLLDGPHRLLLRTGHRHPHKRSYVADNQLHAIAQVSALRSTRHTWWTVQSEATSWQKAPNAQHCDSGKSPWSVSARFLDPIAGRGAAGWQARSMASKSELMDWTEEALTQLGGEGSVVEVCRVVWDRHEGDLRSSDDLFYTWQYDIRWAATKLRKAGRLEAHDVSSGNRAPWRLARP